VKRYMIIFVIYSVGFLLTMSGLSHIFEMISAQSSVEVLVGMLLLVGLLGIWSNIVWCLHIKPTIFKDKPPKTGV